MLGFAQVEAVPRRGRLGQQEERLDLALDGDADGSGVQRAEVLDQTAGRRGVGEIALGHDDAVGEGHLLLRLGHPRDIAFAVDRVDDRDQGLQVELAAEAAVGGKGLQYRTRIGEPRGFDHDPLETRDRAARPVGEQPPQRLLQIGADIAAQAAIAEQHRHIAARPQKRIVDADFAVLVDHDGRVGPFGLIEQRADQGGLPRTQKAGDRDDREPRSARPPLSPTEERCVLSAEQRLRPGFRSPFRGYRGLRHDGRRCRRPAARRQRRRLSGSPRWGPALGAQARSRPLQSAGRDWSCRRHAGRH